MPAKEKSIIPDSEPHCDGEVRWCAETLEQKWYRYTFNNHGHVEAMNYFWRPVDVAQRPDMDDMMIDNIKWLRWRGEGNSEHAKFNECADEIKRLREALTKIRALDYGYDRAEVAALHKIIEAALNKNKGP